MILLTIIAFIVIFSVLILVHEWGHFYMARRAGIKVEEFGIGLPPRAKALHTDKKGTVYSLNWIPFGGYVRLYGEDETDPKVLKKKDSFASKTIWQRTKVIVGGVFMNFVLAWLLLWIGFTAGMKPILVTQDDVNNAAAAGLITTEDLLLIHSVEEGSLFDQSGFQDGDIVTHINNEPVPNAAVVAQQIIRPNTNYMFSFLRDGEPMNIVTATGPDGRLGIAMSTQAFIQEIEKVKHPIHIAAVESAKEVGRLSVLTVTLLGDVVVGIVQKLTVPDGVAGPVGIAQMTHRFVQEGIIALMQFTALLSISLGVINIMPFPALDGGRFLFILFEIVLRRRPSAKWEAAIHTTGFALLMLLILFITWNDILRLFQ